MKTNELKEMNPDGLKKELLELLREQFNLRLKKSTGQLTATHSLRTVRRKIARIKTILSEKVGLNHE